MSLVVCSLLPLAFSNAEFPGDFIGDWRGTMEWSRPGSTTQKVAMRLKIERVGGTPSFTYLLAYGDGGKDERPYRLNPIDVPKGRWQIDEGNGIVLDATWLAGRFVSVFSVGGSTIQTHLSREGQTLVSTMTTYAGEAKSGGRNGVPEVTTFNVVSIQRAVLRRSDR